MDEGKKKIKVTIDKKGNYTIKTLEGFAGEECVQKTQDLEVAIGGQIVDEGKTEDYFRDPEDPIKITFD